ncbi:hypothetical protein QJ857_gp0393 [Tupanvirus soda lake]|uniref:Uncharacterized protein n=2 Tax=Tupanvirus TaxID=2094720 RepID=A0A6N1P3V8_9VIRU|nr:hypothetical protein QJ857_gp0393 [Tupanvirus soda lake]QKU35641.1 hypothetical protein [Tupanvirus soda lake]
MSYLPVFLYPGGHQIPLPENQNVVYKWINSLGGAALNGPLEHGTLRPDGIKASCGNATIDKNGQMVVEYHYNRNK